MPRQGRGWRCQPSLCYQRKFKNPNLILGVWERESKGEGERYPNKGTGAVWIPSLERVLRSSFFCLHCHQLSACCACFLSANPSPQNASKLLSALLFSLAGKIFGAEGMGAFSKLRYQIIFCLPVIEITGSGFAFLWPAPLLFSGITDGGGQGCDGLPTACHLTDRHTSQEGAWLGDEFFYPQRGFLQKKPLVFCYWVSTPHGV